MTFQTKYHPSNTTCSFKVLKTPTSLDVKVDYNDDLNGTITVKTVPSNCTGEIGVYVNYELYTLNLTDGKAVFNVKYYKGTNYIYVYYDGDYYFDGSDWNTTLGMDYDFAFLGKNVTAWQENDFNYTKGCLKIMEFLFQAELLQSHSKGKIILSQLMTTVLHTLN